MCQGRTDCTCCKVHRLSANLLASESRMVMHDGRKHLVIPLVMAKASVVMNGNLLPVEEMLPHTWNGRPVTVSHPTVDGIPVSASASPEVLEEWAIGTIFNARIDGDALKAEAWIDIAKCNRNFPGLIARIKSQETIDVSTGYFCDVEETAGELNGRKYTGIQRNVRPDHLALLPDEVGACSWADGCGVRTNRRLSVMRKTFVANVTKAIEAMSSSLSALQASVKDVIKNERGDDDHRTMMIADLLSDDRSPFLPDDEFALREMSNDTLKKLRNLYLRDDDGDKPDDNSNHGGDPVANKNGAGGPSGEEFKAIVENALKPIAEKVQNLDAIINEAVSKHPALAAFQKAAQEKRSALIERVVSNSTISKEIAETMSDEALEAVANSLAPAFAPAFAGRPVPSANADGKDEAAEAMSSPPTVVDFIRNRNKKEKA